jgi:hypothetical protein
MRAGRLGTVAGTGSFGPLGDGGPAARADLAGACGALADGAGNLLIAGNGNDRVRAVAATTGTFYGQAMTAGDIYTVAGSGQRDAGPRAFLRSGIKAGQALITPIAAQAAFFDLGGAAAGNLIIPDTENSRLRVLAASTGTFYGQPMTAGDIYTVAGGDASGFFGDGGPGTSAGLGEAVAVAVAVDAAGDLLIADANDNRIREVAR